MNYISATEARSNLFKLLQKVNKTHSLIHLHYKKGNAVLLAEEDYESIMETLNLYSSPAFRKSFREAKKQAKNGELFSLDEVFGKNAKKA